MLAGATSLLGIGTPVLLIEFHWGHGPGAGVAADILDARGYGMETLDGRQMPPGWLRDARPRFALARRRPVPPPP